MTESKAYDYIIIGGSPSGCVAAHRLTEDRSVSVLLLEAGGPDTRPEIHNPAAVLSLWGSEVDWNYASEEETHLGGRRLPLNRGKVLGGGSAIHAMIYIRGHRLDYDHWNYLGNEGWSFEDLLPFFKKSEDYDGGASEYHGAGGPLAVCDYATPSPAALAIVDAGVELGFRGGRDWDFNTGDTADSAGIYQFNLTRDGKRSSGASAFLTPVLNRPNLKVETFAQATRLVMENNHVMAVEYWKDGSLQTAIANGEVILAAGTFESPKLLMLSGIGPAALLRAMGIPPVVDLPGVGQNLQDHLRLPLHFDCAKEQPVPQLLAEAGVLARTRDALTAAAPDLQINFNATNPVTLPPDYSGKGPGVTFMSILVRPQSRGSVTLRSHRPQDPPVIRGNFLQCEADIQVQLRGIEICRELIHARAFRDFQGGEVLPGARQTEKELRDYIRGNIWTIWHPVGTCKMGYDALAVVDPQLRVHGVEGVRVADASIMPTDVSANTCAAAYMIGEKAAEMIRQDQ